MAPRPPGGKQTNTLPGKSVLLRGRGVLTDIGEGGIGFNEGSIIASPPICPPGSGKERSELEETDNDKGKVFAAQRRGKRNRIKAPMRMMRGSRFE